MELPREFFPVARKRGFIVLSVENATVTAPLSECEPDLRELCAPGLEEFRDVRFSDETVWGRVVRADGNIELLLVDQPGTPFDQPARRIGRPETP